MPEKSTGCFEDGGSRVEVRVISQEGTSSILCFSRYPRASDRRRCSRITTNAKPIQMRTSATFRTKND